MNKKMLWIASVLFALVLVVSALGGVNKSYASRGDLTTFSAAEISAFRWNAMARFYTAQGVSTTFLSSLNAADRTPYRWNALDQERLLRPTSVAMGVDLTSYDAADIAAYRWNAMARFYISHGLWNRNSGSSNASAATQQVNGERLYSWPGH